MRTVSRLLLTPLLVAILSAACSSGVDESAPADSETTDPSQTAEPTPTATPEPVPDRPSIDELMSRAEPLNIAHAGGDQEGPHSTFFAFDQAVAAGADVLEIDVQLSGDGVLIVQHDDTVDKTTDAAGPVAERTVAELQALDAAYWFSHWCWPCRDLTDDAYQYRGVRTGATPPPPGATADDFRIVTFAELVERYPSHPLDIEIKGLAPDALPVVEALAVEIETAGIEDSVVVVSFDDALVEAFEARLPGVETSPGSNEMTQWLFGREPLEGHRIVQVPPDFDGLAVITPSFWEKVAESDVAVWVWPSNAETQESTRFYAEMIDQGASGIIAGRPSQMPS
jgi:glycerophosphoryl diester phosphodiesterase